jgi:hypothetical protein
MRQKTRHFPFAAVGLALIVVSVAPTVIGMVRSFNQMQRGDDAAAAGTADSSVALAFLPAFVGCGLIGLLFVVVGIVLAIRRSATPVA